MNLPNIKTYVLSVIRPYLTAMRQSASSQLDAVVPELADFRQRLVVTEDIANDTKDKVSVLPTKEYVDELVERITKNEATLNDWYSRISNLLAPGVVLSYSGRTIPTGYLPANGAAVSRTEYPALFAAIGTIWGDGDGSTTFNLPDGRNRNIYGNGTNSVGTYLEPGLPNITGELDLVFMQNSVGVGSLYQETNQVNGHSTQNTNTTGYHNLRFDASRSNPIYGRSNTVQTEGLVFNYIVKY